MNIVKKELYCYSNDRIINVLFLNPRGIGKKITQRKPRIRTYTH